MNTEHAAVVLTCLAVALLAAAASYIAQWFMFDDEIEPRWTVIKISGWATSMAAGFIVAAGVSMVLP